MSHAMGEVFAIPSGESLGHFEYNGTVDYATTAIASRDKIWSRWRTDANYRDCVCAVCVEQPVRLVADYGSGIEWTSRACLVCMAIVGPLSPYGEDEESEKIDGNPRVRGLLT